MRVTTAALSRRQKESIFKQLIPPCERARIDEFSYLKLKQRTKTTWRWFVP